MNARHVDELASLAAHLDVAPWLLPRQSDAETVRHSVWLSESHWDPPTGLSFAYVIAQQGGDGDVIGQCALTALSLRRRVGSVGWDIHPDFAGRGFATEVALSLLDLAFGVCWMRRVRAECYADNAASRRVMEKIGMAPCTSWRVRRDLSRRYPSSRGAVRYEIDAQTWRAQRVAAG